MIEHRTVNQNTYGKSILEFSIYKNKKSKMNESILIQYDLQKNAFSLHIYSILLHNITKNNRNETIIDARKNKPTYNKYPLRVVSQIKRGSLSFSRHFFKDPAEKKYVDSLHEKYPQRKVKNNKYFPPLVLLVAHYCDYFYISDDNIAQERINDSIATIIAQFDEFLQDDIHQALRIIGKPLYLKGEVILTNFHQSRELPESFIKKLSEEKILATISKQKEIAYLTPVIKGMRKEMNEQLPLLKDHADPLAVSHILDSNSQLLPLHKHHFPLVIVGEPEARRNLILNILKNANARFLIFDPMENYGQLANLNPRIRGFLLGNNYYLNIISTENEKIREQVYAFWFARIIAHIANLKSELTKTLETYLLGVYRDSSNQARSVFQFRDFANQELTSEVTKMGRNESIIITNVLYPLGTYDEISLITRVGRTYNFDSLFDTKGAILQFAKNDEQLTKIVYLFSILKMRSVQMDDPKILVLENIDEILNFSPKQQENDLVELILGLKEEFQIILGARSPVKIKELFKSSKAKFVNRLVMPGDVNLLIDDYNIGRRDILLMSKLTEREFLLLIPEFSVSNYIKIDLEPNTKMRLKMDSLEEESSKRILHAKDYLQIEGIAPEVKKAIFGLIRILREKPSKMLPEEGLEQLLEDCTIPNILRAKEIARDEVFIKLIENSPEDSSEKINLIKLTERGEEYYKSYLDLKKQIPLISMNNLIIEKDFEKDIFKRMEKAERLLKIGDHSSMITIILEIANLLLGALPEEDRFCEGKVASKLLEHWSYISSIRESKNHSKIEYIFHDFSQIVANAMKEIRNQIIDKAASNEETTQPNRKKSKNKETKNNPIKEEKEFEIGFKISQESKNLSGSNDSRKRHIELLEESPDDKSEIFPEGPVNSFHAATDDLKSAGLSHLDSKGRLISPKKFNIFDDDIFEQKIDLEILNDNPFVPASDERDISTNILQKQEVKLHSIKKQLMETLAKHLNVSFIDDEEFIWHCLDSRFTGKIDDGYVISEVVSTLKMLYRDSKENALIPEKEFTKLERLIKSSNLLSDGLIADLKQYIQEK